MLLNGSSELNSVLKKRLIDKGFSISEDLTDELDYIVSSRTMVFHPTAQIVTYDEMCRITINESIPPNTVNCRSKTTDVEYTLTSEGES